MKITRRQLRRIILQEKQDLPGRFLNWVFDSDEYIKDELEQLRHPSLDTIVDAVNIAKHEVEFAVLKNFLFNINSKFANRELIEVTGNDLRRLIRDVLLEKKFSDITPGKSIYLDVPEEEIAFHDASTIDLDDEIFDLVTTAYASLPGGNIKVKSPNDLPGSYTVFRAVDVDEDPDPDAVVFGKMRGPNLKIGGMGHDGGKGIRASITELLNMLRQPGTFAELSGKPAEIAIKAGIPAIIDPDVVQAVVRRDIDWVGAHPTGQYPAGYEGWYSRGYSGESGSPHLKMIFGNV